MRQLQLFTTTELAAMRDRTASRSYSPAGEAFRREHARHRAWGLSHRHAERLRRARGPVTTGGIDPMLPSSSGSAAQMPPDQSTRLPEASEFPAPHDAASGTNNTVDHSGPPTKEAPRQTRIRIAADTQPRRPKTHTRAATGISLVPNKESVIGGRASSRPKRTTTAGRKAHHPSPTRSAPPRQPRAGRQRRIADRSRGPPERATLLRLGLARWPPVAGPATPRPPTPRHASDSGATPLRPGGPSHHHPNALLRPMSRSPIATGRFPRGPPASAWPARAGPPDTARNAARRPRRRLCRQRNDQAGWRAITPKRR